MKIERISVLGRRAKGMSKLIDCYMRSTFIVLSLNLIAQATQKLINYKPLSNTSRIINEMCTEEWILSSQHNCIV